MKLKMQIKCPKCNYKIKINTFRNTPNEVLCSKCGYVIKLNNTIRKTFYIFNIISVAASVTIADLISDYINTELIFVNSLIVKKIIYVGIFFIIAYIIFFILDFCICKLIFEFVYYICKYKHYNK